MSNQPDKAGFVKLIQDNQGIIFKICNSYCHNKNEREDLAQEIIYQLWKSVNSFDGSYKFSTWMYRVALNVAISHYRKEQKTRPLITLSEQLQEIEDKGDVSKIEEENLNRLQLFISELKELDRALMLLYLDEKSYSEIGEILGITETNVATKISRIKEKLKEKFSMLKNY